MAQNGYGWVLLRVLFFKNRRQREGEGIQICKGVLPPADGAMLVGRFNRRERRERDGRPQDFDRISTKLPMRYIDPRSGVEGEAQLQDISAKGIGLVTQAGLSRKTALEMWIEIPDKGEPLYTRGEVVWSQMVAPDKFRTGVRLEKADLMGLSRVLRVAA